MRRSNGPTPATSPGLEIPTDARGPGAAAAIVTSLLVSGALGPVFTGRGITHLFVSGIRTEQCCETTTRHASDLGFDVTYVTEATLTFPMTRANGRVYTVAEIRERTELVLAGRFARIATAAEALEALDAAPAAA